MLSAYGSVWVASRHADAVVRIDPKSNTVTAKITLGGEPAYLVDDGKAVWVIDFAGRGLVRIDPQTNQPSRVPLPGDPGGWPVAGAGAVFQATSVGLVKVDSSSQTIVETKPVMPPSGVAFANGLVWIAKPDKGLERLHPATLATKDSVAPDVDGSGIVAFDGTWMWAAGGSTASQIDPVSGAVVATYQLPANVDGGMGVASGGRFWLQRGYPNAFAFIDGATKKLSPFQALPTNLTQGLFFLVLSPHDVWISDWDANTVYRVDPGP
jgi:YVTN family beta-propeller protein